MANRSKSLLALKPGTIDITYIYEIRDVSFAQVEALGVLLRESHVRLVDYRTLHNLTRDKMYSLARNHTAQP